MKHIVFFLLLLLPFCLTAQKMYSTQSAYQSDVKVYVVDKEYQADIKVFFTDKEYKAGWKNNKKKHLLY